MAFGYSGRIAFHLCFMGLLLSPMILKTHVDGHAWKKQLPMPCKNLVLCFHDILYNGKNAHNATSALVAAPAWGNLTFFAGPFRFGDLAVFDDPITLDNNLHSPPVGRAQGFYLYDMKNTYSAWLGFTFVLNSTDYKGTITFNGADPTLKKYRDISVVGGTGYFLMARGIATLMFNRTLLKTVAEQEFLVASTNVSKLNISRKSSLVTPSFSKRSFPA